jgi:hypothetical protein
MHALILNDPDIVTHTNGENHVPPYAQGWSTKKVKIITYPLTHKAGVPNIKMNVHAMSTHTITNIPKIMYSQIFLRKHTHGYHNTIFQYN